MAKDVAETILELRRVISEAKEQKAKVEGHLEATKSELKSKFGVKTIGSAGKKLDKINEEIEDLEDEIQESCDSLEKELSV